MKILKPKIEAVAYNIILFKNTKSVVKDSRTHVSTAVRHMVLKIRILTASVHILLKESSQC